MMKNVVVEQGESSKAPLVGPAAAGGGCAVAVADVFLRFFAIIGTIGSAIAMSTANDTLPFFTQFIQFEAKYSDILRSSPFPPSSSSTASPRTTPPRPPASSAPPSRPPRTFTRPDDSDLWNDGACGDDLGGSFCTPPPPPPPSATGCARCSGLT